MCEININEMMLLPEEIIYEIVKFTGCNTLNTLSKSSRQIKRMAEKQIKKRRLVYSCLKYTNPKNIKYYFPPDLMCCQIHDKNKEIMEIIQKLNNKSGNSIHFSSNGVLQKAIPYLRWLFGNYHICCGGTGVMFHNGDEFFTQWDNVFPSITIPQSRRSLVLDVEPTNRRELEAQLYGYRDTSGTFRETSVRGRNGPRIQHHFYHANYNYNGTYNRKGR